MKLCILCKYCITPSPGAAPGSDAASTDCSRFVDPVNGIPIACHRLRTWIAQPPHLDATGIGRVPTVRGEQCWVLK